MTADVCFTDAFLFWFSVYAFTSLLFCHPRCPQGMMGSRALSHDSIFLADEVLTDAEPARVLSQENVQSKIKALQVQTFTLGVLLRIERFWMKSKNTCALASQTKLQLQKMHLGPPPLVLPVRRPEDQESLSDDDSHPHSPSEISRGDVTTQGTLSKVSLSSCFIATWSVICLLDWFMSSIV